MSFKYEAITDEVSKKVDRQNKYKEITRVTPLEYSEAFPIKLSGDGHCVLTERYKLFAERIKHLEVRSDDTWVVTYPKTGTTWTQELIWLLLNNLNFEEANSTHLRFRFPYLELSSLDDHKHISDTLKLVEEMPSPRFIKSHLPIQFLPDQLWTVKPKIIYVKRDPKDVAVSYHHNYKILQKYTGTMDEFMDAFVQDGVLFSTLYPHMIDFSQAAEKLDNILVLQFEEMKRDLESVIRKTANFLNVSVTDEDVVNLADHLSFKNMRDNKAINFEFFIEQNLRDIGASSEAIQNSKFLRKGEVGSWKQELSSDLIEKLEKWSRKNEEIYPLSRR